MRSTGFSIFYPLTFYLLSRQCMAQLNANFLPQNDFKNVINLSSLVLNSSSSKTMHLFSSIFPNNFRSLCANYSFVYRNFTSLTKSDTNHFEEYCHDKPKNIFSVVVAIYPTEDDLVNLLYSNSSMSSTIFIVVCEQASFAERFQRFVSQAWKRKYIFRVVLFGCSENSSIASVFDPFLDCENRFFKNISIVNFPSVAAQLNQEIKYLNSCPLKISMYIREQTAVLLKNFTFTGQDGRLIQILAETMLFKPKLYLNNNRLIYGYRMSNGIVEGTFGKLLDGSTDICLNGHFLKNYNCGSIELTRHITSDRVCLLTPKAGVIPPIMTVLKSFQLQVWVMVVVTYLVIVIFYHFASSYLFNSKNDDWALEIFRIFVASPIPRKTDYNWEKLLFAACWFFSIVILNSFQGSLVTFLNTPMHFPDIDTFEDLIESELPIRTSSPTFRELLLSDPNLSKLVNKLFYSQSDEDVYNFEGRFAGFQRINVYNLKYFQDIIYKLNERESRLLHTMKQCLMSYFISYAIPKNSPYRRRIDQIISRVEHSGLLIKWNSDSAKYIFTKHHLVTRGNRKDTKVFSLIDLEVAFFALNFGLLISCVVFFFEICVVKRQCLRRIASMLVTNLNFKRLLLPPKSVVVHRKKKKRTRRSRE